MHRDNFFRLLLFLLLIVFRLSMFAASPVQERADRFLALANAGYQALYRVNSEAQWTAVTDVTPDHDAAAEATGKLTRRLTGTQRSSIRRASCSRTRKNQRADRTAVKQFSECSGGPTTNWILWRTRAAETSAGAAHEWVSIQINGQKTTANQIDDAEKSSDSGRAQSGVGSVQEIGPALKDNLVVLREIAQRRGLCEMKYPDYSP
jgi:hypothetical protein